jgi:hypothetical protein
MDVSPVVPGTKNDCAGQNQQQFILHDPKLFICESALVLVVSRENRSRRISTLEAAAYQGIGLT